MTLQLEDCVRIVPEALEEEFVRVPGDMAYWNNLYANAYQLWLEAKLARELLYAQIYKSEKSRLLASSKGRVTEGEVESEVLADHAYQNARVREIQTESDKLRLHGIMEAIRSKRDMLISIGAHQRAEMQGDPTIRRQAAIGREVQAGKDGAYG